MPVPEDTLLRIIEYGTLAPSGDNCQPWIFRWDGERLHLVNDEKRDTSLYNVRNTASFIAHGALIENMNIAAAETGYELKAELFPRGDEDPLVAVITFSQAPVKPDRLFPFIDKRCTNRSMYRSDELGHTARKRLMEVPAKAGCGELFLVEDRQGKDILARAASLNDRLLFENRELHDFLFHQIRWSRGEAERTGDGMDIRTLGLYPPERVAFRTLKPWPMVRFMNRLGLSRLLPLRSYLFYRRSAAIGMLQMPGTSPEDFVTGGRVLQRIWLTATSLGLSFQPITGITFLIQRLWLEDGRGLSNGDRKLVEKAAAELNRVIPIDRGRAMIMLFRLGRSGPPKGRSLRRKVVMERTKP